MKSLREMGSGTEYIWPGDEQWWSGLAPVLFPIVGGLKDNKYRHASAEHSLPQPLHAAAVMGRTAAF